MIPFEQQVESIFRKRIVFEMFVANTISPGDDNVPLCPHSYTNGIVHPNPTVNTLADTA